MGDTGATTALLPNGIVVMRHGRREDSVNPLWQASARFPFDTPLVASESEIDDTAKRLRQAGHTFDVVYTSPFLRCIETVERLMRALGCVRIPVFIHKGLSEVHNANLLFKSRTPSLGQKYGLWLWRATYQRRSRPLRERFAVKARILESQWPEVPESEYQATIRFRDVMLQLASRHPGKQVLVVAHGKAVQVAYEALGSPGRVEMVGFAGFVACRPTQQHGQPAEQSGAAAADGAPWTKFELDPEVPWFGVDVVRPQESS